MEHARREGAAGRAAPLAPARRRGELIWVSSQKTTRGEVPTSPRSFPFRFYFPTWGAEGSRHRRYVELLRRSGTTISGVVPDRFAEEVRRTESGAGTAFPAKSVV